MRHLKVLEIAKAVFLSLCNSLCYAQYLLLSGMGHSPFPMLLLYKSLGGMASYYEQR